MKESDSFDCSWWVFIIWYLFIWSRKMEALIRKNIIKINEINCRKIFQAKEHLQHNIHAWLLSQQLNMFKGLSSSRQGSDPRLISMHLSTDSYSHAAITLFPVLKQNTATLKSWGTVIDGYWRSYPLQSYTSIIRMDCIWITTKVYLIK